MARNDVRVEEEIRRSFEWLMASVPDAPNATQVVTGTAATDRPRRRWMSGPLAVAAGAVVVVLAVGVPLIISVGGGGDLPAGVLSEDPLVVQGQLGPPPMFDTSGLGEEQPLVPFAVLSGSDRLGLADIRDFEPTRLVAVGRVERSGFRVYVVDGAFIETDDPGRDETQRCVRLVSDQDGSSACSGIAGGPVVLEAGLVPRPGLPSEAVRALESLPESKVLVHVAVANLPPDTAVVSITVRVPEARFWQRPIAAAGAFLVDVDAAAVESDTAVLQILAFDEEGRVLADTTGHFISETGPSGLEISDDQLIPQIATWVNQLGLVQTDTVVWRQRLQRACIEGVWDDEIATRLAEEFIAEDLPLSVRSEDLGPPLVGDAAQALWTMAVNVCRNSFPEGEIEQGPPFR